MDVICHQAPSQNTDRIAETMLAKQFKVAVAEAILVGKENVLPVVSALRDVMRHSWNNESWSTSHVR